MKARRSAIGTAAALVMLAGLLLPASPAMGHRATHRDRNDSPSRLDLRSATVSHAGASRIRYVVSTWATWPSRVLREDGAFAIGIDLNNDLRRYERIVWVFTVGGRLRGFVVRGRTVVDRIGVTRPNGRSFSLAVTRRSLGNPGSYKWAVLSFFEGPGCARTCVDVLPNRPPLFLHDLTPPEISLTSFPDPSTQDSMTNTFEVRFRVSDEGGARLRRWTLQGREFGTDGWSAVASGTSGGNRSVDVAQPEGTAYEYRVVAKDRQGNVTRSAIRRVTVPLDEDDPAVDLQAGGDWVLATDDAAFFQATRHTTSVVGATASFTRTFRRLHIMGGPSAGGTFQVTIDGNTTGPIAVDGTTPKGAVVFESGLLALGEHDVTIEVLSGEVVLDGFLLFPYA